MLISPSAGSVTADVHEGGGGGGLITPGVRMSPAYVGTLKARARTVAEQMALKAFIFVSKSDFRVVRDGSQQPTR